MSRHHGLLQHAHLMSIHSKIQIGFICACAAAGVPSARADDNPLNFDQVLGLYVDVENSADCDGSNSERQVVTAHAGLSGGNRGGCPVKLAITVTGVVETPVSYTHLTLPTILRV